MGTDINFMALEATSRTKTQNKCDIDLIQTNFADAINYRMKESIDLIIFNPPYVVTSEQELKNAQKKKDLEAAWAGGTNGL